MPTRKHYLNRAEQARHLAATQDLRIAGLDIDVPEEWLQGSRLLDVTVARSPASVAFELPNAGVGYAIYLRLVARQFPLTLSHYRITTQWDDEISLMSLDKRSPICRFGWLTFSRAEVLNPRFDNSLRFHYRGQVIEGTLLATGLQPIPAAYRTGARIPFQLTIADSLGYQILVEADLYLERRRKRKNAGAPRGAGLYEPLKPRERCAVISGEDLRIPHRQRLETGNPDERE